MSPALYFAPTYFSAFYFPQYTPVNGASLTQETPSYRDRDAYTAIVQSLQQTGEFADVTLGTAIDGVRLGADRLPLAVVAPSEWSELDDVDPSACLRHVSYTLTLVVRSEDSEQRFQLLDRLTSVAQNAIDGSDLGGGCVGGLTKLRMGRFDTRPHYPEQRLTLRGTFTYFISSQTGHDTTT